ncbi:hypothetical protein DRO66_02425 [Candidatus Bathyarchaeota archaeon]|nr:MAG: hypothetical protein DRO66_02425 [Candidatus Bathyarchaeota archaeon]
MLCELLGLENKQDVPLSACGDLTLLYQWDKAKDIFVERAYALQTIAGFITRVIWDPTFICLTEAGCIYVGREKCK